MAIPPIQNVKQVEPKDVQKIKARYNALEQDITYFEKQIQSGSMSLKQSIDSLVNHLKKQQVDRGV